MESDRVRWSRRIYNIVLLAILLGRSFAPIAIGTQDDNLSISMQIEKSMRDNPEIWSGEMEGFLEITRDLKSKL